MTRWLACVFLLAACNDARPRPPLATDADVAHFEADERELAALARRFDADVEHMGVLYGDPALESYLDEVLERVVPEFASTLHVRVLRAVTTRAAVLESGTLYVDAGALAVLDDEAQLAAFLSQEAAAFRLRHPILRTESFAARWVIQGRPYGAGWQRDEHLADDCDPLAYDALVRAGYDVASAVEGWDRLRAYQLRSGSYDRSPAADRRAAALRRLAATGTTTGGERARERYLDATRTLFERVLAAALEGFDPEAVLLLVPHASGRLTPAAEAYWNARAHALRANPGDAEAELALLEESLRLAPGFAPAEGRLGTRLARRGERPRARALLAHAIAGTEDEGERSFLEATLKELGP